MVALVTCKNEEDPIKNEVARVATTITQWELSVAMETRVLIRPGSKPMMLQIKFDCNWPCCLRDIQI